VRRRGGSVVDVTFATPAVAQRVSDWRVLERVETLSDHLYIRFEVSSQQRYSTSPTYRFPRWSITKLDKDLAEEAAIVQR
jgi:hypothetical protein